MLFRCVSLRITPLRWLLCWLLLSMSLITLDGLANGVASSISEGSIFIRDLRIDVYGKRLTSDTLFAIKTKSLTVKFLPIRFIQNTENYIQGHFV